MRNAISQPLRQAPALAYEKLSDPVLVARAKDGDAQALEALLTRHQPRVERLARHILRDPDDGNDAAQESLAKVCVRLKQFRGGAQFSTWLHRLVVNTCLDAVERRRARVHEPLSEFFQSDDDPARDAGISELRRELCAGARRGLAAAGADRSLEGRARLLVRGDREAAGMPVGTAKCHAHRGRARLSEHLEEPAA